MAPARLSVPRAVSLNGAPSSCFRPEPTAARRVVPVVVRRPGTVVAVVSVAAQRRLVAVAAATKAVAPAASGEGRGKPTFIEEMRAAAMRMHTKDQAREGENKALEPPVAKWEPTVVGYLRYLVDSKLVFETLEAVVAGAAVPWYAEFRNTGLERTEALKKDLEWFKEQGHAIPEPSDAGVTYASFLQELSEKEPHAFINHFYNLYFGHAAGGRIIGKMVAEKINLQKQLGFYEWEGNLPQLQQNVRDKLNQVASSWSREEKDRCLDEMEKSFVCSVDIRRHMFN